MEELLREAACYGRLDEIRALISRGVNVNSQHSLNGWTALHWAVKRGHSIVVKYLLENGADQMLVNNNGQIPADLATDQKTLIIFGKPYAAEKSNGFQDSLSFIPSYINQMISDAKCEMCGQFLSRKMEEKSTQTEFLSNIPPSSRNIKPIVVKVRLRNEEDFIEVDLEPSDLNFSSFLEIICRELSVNVKQVKKLRKCPNTLIRNDRDIVRLVNYQEVEIETFNINFCQFNK